jgi:putative ABC transport system permease protein
MTRWLAVVGLVCAACGALMLVLPSRDLVLAFSALGLVTVGLALLVPASVIAFVSVCNGFIRSDRLLPERLGCQTVGATINRTGTAAAALMIASATGVGIGIMVLSFRVSVSDWLDDVLRADFYVSGTATAISADNAPIDAVLIDAIRAINAVAATSTVLRTKARGPRGEFRLSAFELPAPARLGFRFLRGAPQAVWTRWELEDVVIVTEPLAYHNRLSVGDELSLRTQAGLVAFRVVGVYADYATEHGSISMSRATHDRHWEDQRYDGIGVYAREGAPLGALSDAISTLTANRPDLEVHARQRLKETSLTIFDRTFLITDVLRLVAIVVAFVGVFGALLAQQLERIREYGTFRALGFSDGELGRVVMTQTGVIGVTAATLALPVGVLLAVLLIDVINVRSFGWSMTLHVPGSYLIQSWVITVAAALLAGIYPAYKAINIPPAVALREE